MFDLSLAFSMDLALNQDTFIDTPIIHFESGIEFFKVMTNTPILFIINIEEVHMGSKPIL